MSMIINDELVEARLLEERRAKGLDGHDEVWDGVYVMSPLANNEHQRIAFELGVIFYAIVNARGLGTVYPGTNVSDRDDDWTKNYRVPDMLVFLKDTKAEDRGSHWYGGPDLAVEIVSPGDRALEKLEFYASASTQELLVIDRNPWQLTLYRRGDDGNMHFVATSTLEQETVLESAVISAKFVLVGTQPCIRVIDIEGPVTHDISIDLR